MKIYVASKTKHADIWLAFARRGVPISSSWIYEAGQGETLNWEDLWERCVSEAHAADALIVYRQPGEQLKGAFVEVGAALAGSAEVVLVGNFEREEVGSWILHRNTHAHIFGTVEAALEALGVRVATSQFELPMTTLAEHAASKRDNVRARDLYAMFQVEPVNLVDLIAMERSSVLHALRARLEALVASGEHPDQAKAAQLASKLVLSALVDRVR